MYLNSYFDTITMVFYHGSRGRLCAKEKSPGSFPFYDFARVIIQSKTVSINEVYIMSAGLGTNNNISLSFQTLSL